METIVATLERLRLRMLGNSCSFEPPCPENEIHALLVEVERDLGVRLPDRYLDLLRITDGLYENALSIFGSRQRRSAAARKAGSEWMICGIVDENLGYRLNCESYSDLLFFARREGRLYAQVIGAGEFVKVRDEDETTLEVYETFDEMIVAAITSALNQ